MCMPMTFQYLRRQFCKVVLFNFGMQIGLAFWFVAANTCHFVLDFFNFSVEPLPNIEQWSVALKFGTYYTNYYQMAVIVKYNR